MVQEHSLGTLRGRHHCVSNRGGQACPPLAPGTVTSRLRATTALLASGSALEGSATHQLGHSVGGKAPEGDHGPTTQSIGQGGRPTQGTSRVVSRHVAPTGVRMTERCDVRMASLPHCLLHGVGSLQSPYSHSTAQRVTRQGRCSSWTSGHAMASPPTRSRWKDCTPSPHGTLHSPTGCQSENSHGATGQRSLLQLTVREVSVHFSPPCTTVRVSRRTPPPQVALHSPEGVQSLYWQGTSQLLVLHGRSARVGPPQASSAAGALTRVTGWVPPPHEAVQGPDSFHSAGLHVRPHGGTSAQTRDSVRDLLHPSPKVTMLRWRVCQLDADVAPTATHLVEQGDQSLQRLYTHWPGHGNSLQGTVRFAGPQATAISDAVHGRPSE